MKPGHYWHPEKRCWRPIVVKGKTTGPEVKPDCADCEALPWNACKCWPEEPRVPDASPRVQIQSITRDLSERLNAEADERFQLALEI